MKVGIIGCGNISDIYVRNSALFRDIDIAACADVFSGAAERVSAAYGVPVLGVDELLASEEIDIVLNLTVPAAHAEISIAALEAGKHVYTEKPLAISLEDGARITRLAAGKGLRVGSAPDTMLGPALQEARRALDDGRVGQVLTGHSAIMSKGMEHWHPNPAFFYQKGGGPVLDIGPYHISALVALLGPVASVRATGLVSPVERRFGTGPKTGETFPVDTFTTVNAVLSFASGANINFIASWDVWHHGVTPIELHGTLASMRVPDPDTFGGDVEISQVGRLRNPHDPDYIIPIDWKAIDTRPLPYGRHNYPHGNPAMANYRSLGLADMANAIVNGRPHRCSGDFSLHVLATMLGILEAAESGKPVEIGHACQRPEAFTSADAVSLLKVAPEDISGEV